MCLSRDTHMLLLNLPYTPYADWIYVVMSTTVLLTIVWLVLRPKQN